MQKNIITTPTANDDAFILEPLPYQPTVGPKPGEFIDVYRNTAPKNNGAPCNDLIIATKLDERDALGQPIVVLKTMNMLPRGRGAAEFKTQMESFLGKPLTPLQLAKPLVPLAKKLLVGQRVIVNYKTDHLGHVVFDSFTPETKNVPTET